VVGNPETSAKQALLPREMGAHEKSNSQNKLDDAGTSAKTFEKLAVIKPAKILMKQWLP
jgi:hypothetical protein